MTDKRLEQLTNDLHTATQVLTYVAPRVMAARETLAKLEDELREAEDARERAWKAFASHMAPSGVKLREVA